MCAQLTPLSPRNMDDEVASLELQVMRNEYQWLLNEEVKRVLNELRNLISETLKNFNSYPDQSSECQVKTEKFLLLCPNGVHQSKCMVTLAGDLICEADLGLRLQKQPVIIYQTRIYPDAPWRLQQVQDARNHLRFALSSIESHDALSSSPSSLSGPEVLSFLESLISQLRRGRDCLSLPKIHSIDELIKMPTNKVFKPTLPQDTAAMFFVQAQKLILAVYHLTTSQSRTEITSRYQLECSVPWLNDTLLLFTIALHKCQQLKDKVAMFVGHESRFKMHCPGFQIPSESNGTAVEEVPQPSVNQVRQKNVSQMEVNNAEVTCL